MHFPFFIPLWVWLGTLQDCIHAQCHLPLSIVIRMRLVIRQSKLPACLAEVQLAQKLSGIYATGLVKLADKMDEICINGKLSIQEPSEWRVFCIPVSSFTILQPRIWPDSSTIESQVVLKINEVNNLTAVTSLSNWSLRVFPK